VHFPWCLAKCPYCDFVSYATASESLGHAAYADAVIREIEARASQLEGRQVGSVFFGGGTPSLWQAHELGRVLSRIRSAIHEASPFASTADPDLEVTVECNPTSLDENRARALAQQGVGRLSIGVQSLRDERLRYLGRLHDARGAREAVRVAVRAGVPRVSADLIFGLPGQSATEARDEALELADLGLTHLSCYQLTIESGTRFGELARRGRLPLADDGVVAEAFLAIDEALTARGLVHYEVSNYARPGQEARHNLGYWHGDEYLGLGCAAVGFVRGGFGREDFVREGFVRAPDTGEGARGVRYRNLVQPERYIEATRHATQEAAGGGDPLAESSESLDGPTLLRERIMLGLRLAQGLDVEVAANALNAPGWTPERMRAAAWLEQRGRIVRTENRIRVPRSAWLWTDDTAARLF
jgi:putative oxygen-independent coproporphyrinogen III oxidase